MPKVSRNTALSSSPRRKKRGSTAIRNLLLMVVVTLVIVVYGVASRRKLDKLTGSTGIGKKTAEKNDISFSTTAITTTRTDAPLEYEEVTTIPLEYEEVTTIPMEELRTVSSPSSYPRFFTADGYSSGHRDGRFSAAHDLTYVVKPSLTNLFRAWARFTLQHNVQYWLVHGTLLGWHWNKSIMELDEDIDIAMTLHTMRSVLEPLNGTVWEGQYIVHINQFYKKRQRTAVNSIDAEFIDTMGGYKIDMTAFSEYSPTNNYNLPSRETSKQTFIYASDGHKYDLGKVFPLKQTVFEGMPAFVPAKPQDLLVEEYKSSSLTNDYFQQFRFHNDAGAWVPDDPAKLKFPDGGCNIRTAKEMFRNASRFFIPWELRQQLKHQTTKDDNELNAAIQSQLSQVDIDNSISPIGPTIGEDQIITVAEFNVQRGTHWCKAVKLIQSDPSASKADIIFINEVDWGCSRSSNLHTARLMALELGMNYAWGVEFLELTPGDKGETEAAVNANDVPMNRRGLDWQGNKLDALGLHGSAIFSKWPLRNVQVVRFPGIHRLYHNDPATPSVTANGYEKRLGGRMAIYATIDNVPGYQPVNGATGKIHLGSFHLNVYWDKRFDSAWKEVGVETMRRMKHHHDDVRDPSRKDPFFIGGDGWGTEWCRDEVGFRQYHTLRSGDWICGRNAANIGDVVTVKANGIADHHLYSLTTKLLPGADA